MIETSNVCCCLNCITVQFRYIDELLVCATDASKAECGAGAAAYGNKAMRLELGPLLETIGCGTLPKLEMFRREPYSVNSGNFV